MLHSNYSEKTFAHSIQSSEVHARDKARQDILKGEKRRARWYRRDLEEEDMQGKEELFESDVEGLGMGKKFTVTADESLQVTEPEEWKKQGRVVGRAGKEYHAYTFQNGRDYYRKKKIPGGDLKRVNLELRPDASRAIEYMVKDRSVSAKELQKALDDIRAEKKRLFEEIYKRKVLFAAEHTDTGQYHTDLWHFGLKPDVVMENGKEKHVILRDEFRLLGVGPGAARWDRHRSALVDAGVDPEKVMPETLKMVERDTRQATKQNKEDPRDLRILRSLDQFVSKRLHEVSPEACKKALADYSQHLRKEYLGGNEGVQIVPTKEEKEIKKLKDEVKVLKNTLGKIGKVLGAIVKLPKIPEMLRAVGLWHPVIGLSKIVDFGYDVGKLWPTADEVEKVQREQEGPKVTGTEGGKSTRSRKRTKTKRKERERQIKPPEDPPMGVA